MSGGSRGPAYRAETERLVIRCWNPVDAPLLKEAIDASLDHLRPWMPWAEHEPEELAAKVERLRRFRGEFDLGTDFVYGIFDPDEKRVVGGTGLHTRIGPGALEIGYWIRVGEINRGLATEVSAALTRVAFEVHDVHRVVIQCDPDNERSAAVPRKLGFVHEVTLRENLPAGDGTFRDTMVWTMLRSEYTDSVVRTHRVAAFDAIGTRLL